MDIQRKTVLQVAVSVAVGLLFVGGLLGLSSVYGSEISYENEPFAGTVTGELREPADGTVSLEGELDGQFEERAGGLAASINGTVDGTPTNGTLTGPLEATITDEIASGTIAGTVSGTVEDGTFEGTFEGTVDATDPDTAVTPTGGLALVGLIAAFIVAMPIVGYLIERSED